MTARARDLSPEAVERLASMLDRASGSAVLRSVYLDTRDAEWCAVTAASTLRALAAENARLKRLEHGLRNEAKDYHDEMHKGFDEIARLQAVLSPLVNHPLFHDREYLSQELNEKLDAARAALPEGDEP